ncbi:acylphosphatase [Salipaludibacillus aurantiacus]|uniref:acylphosphatase n=1 Tax=Salipaludibacillus aurantiacus TaxID=1601833 RepID=A0A1H9VFV5_9BACI|nr:acylphosphatase [Salipaludibacillus aurantiacus]SES20354.1 D-alanine-D-alanine ligase [Salipaludibacillus aurantiacus]
MTDTKYKWLPHLEDAVPKAGQGKRISTYTVALEGWRRGIRLRFYSAFDEENKLKVRYSLKYKDREHHFALSKGDKVTEEAFDICDDKDLTKKYLSKAGVPVPLGKKFSPEATDEEILEYANSLGYPLVLKPVSANGGKGVFANVQDEDVLKGAIPYVRKELEYPEVIVETHVPGEKEFRVIVIEDRVLGAMHRIPANVVGDGKQTIRQLIASKNAFRKKNPHLTSRMIRIDKEVVYMVEQAGYTLDSVLEKDKRIYLRVQSNLSNGGDSVDVTNELSPELEKIARDATKAIPGLAQSGVDIIVNDEDGSGVVIEVNSRPGLGGHLFPMEGTPRDFAKEFIDFYFPETANDERSTLYFDFNSIVEPLKTRSAAMVELPLAPKGKLYGKKYTLTGEVQKVGYRKWVKREALKRGLNGFAKNEADGSVSVVVASPDKNLVEKFKNVCMRGPEKADVHAIIEEEWTKPIRLGFRTMAAKKKLKSKDYGNLSKAEYKKIARKYDQIINSTSWKITAPIRKALDILKKIAKKR